MEHLKNNVGRGAWGVKWVAVLLGLLLPLGAGAGDLTRSITFADGQRLTAANLHTLVDGASVNTTFLTGKTLLATVDGTDYVLIYDTSTGTFKKMTLATLIMGNTDLITTQVEATEPAGNDLFLIYDASGGTLAKLSFANLFTGNSNLIGNLPALTNLSAPVKVWLQHGGTNVHVALSDFWRAFEYLVPITNLLAHTSPTNTDALLIWDSAAGTNKQTTLSGLVTNLPVTTNPTNAVISVVAGGELRQMTLSNVATTVRSVLAPQFIAPVNVYSNTAGATNFYSLASAGIPDGAAAVLLETWAESHTSVASAQPVKVSANANEPQLTLLYLQINDDNRPGRGANQAMCAVSATNTFHYAITATTGPTVLNVIGYY
jgi:hypothetical protein